MIELHISPKIDCHLQLKERLEDMSLARKVIESEETKIAILTEGDKQYYGCEQIELFLAEYETFKKRWYECRCDKYEFDDD